MEFTVRYGGGEHQAVAALHSLDIYEQEFGRDLIKDVYGVVKVTEDDVKGATDAGDGVLLRVDYTAVNWTALLRATWACLKNADDSTPRYDTWVKQADGINLQELQNAAFPAFEDAFFPARDGDAEKEADAGGR